jgi:hypothetical protein
LTWEVCEVVVVWFCVAADCIVTFLSSGVSRIWCVGDTAELRMVGQGSGSAFLVSCFLLLNVDLDSGTSLETIPRVGSLFFLPPLFESFNVSPAEPAPRPTPQERHNVSDDRSDS